MKILKIIILLLNILLFINTIHFGLFAILPFLKKEKKQVKKEKKKNKFLILIAARNEEKVIGNLIDSLKTQNYDKDLFKICVIPNNTTDNTKQIALDKKCLVIEPNFKTKTKGEVLNFAFDYFKNDNTFDSYVIFDADNIVDENFLKVMNNKINEGYRVIQGFRDTKNLYENSISGSYAIFFYTQNLFLYTPRERIGESSTINGTGYIVLKSYIDQFNYKASTSTEDIELTCISHIKNEKIGFAKDAIFYDEQVSRFNTSMKQRKRWIQGSMQVFKKYYKELFKNIKEKRNFDAIDMFQILFLPINQAYAFILLLLSYIFIIPFKYVLLSIIISYIGEFIFSIFVLKFYKKDVKRLLPAILYFPIYHLSWIPIYIYSLFNSNNTWEEIKHTSTLKIEEITK
ncbi:MAG: glycosyltransferase [Bacilli bacterium]|nr:glycosyltransferase [Bacilli bacterium]